MPEKYYVDTCIWRDYFENRSDRFRPLGDWAFAFFQKILSDDCVVIYSGAVDEELSDAYPREIIKVIISVIPEEKMFFVKHSRQQLLEAKALAKEHRIPVADALHIILARDNSAIIITRDKHFAKGLLNIRVHKPEDLI